MNKVYKSKCVKWFPDVTVEPSQVFSLECCFENNGDEQWPEDVKLVHKSGNFVKIVSHSKIVAGEPFSVKIQAIPIPGNYWTKFRLKSQYEFGECIHLGWKVQEKPKIEPAEVKGSSLLDDKAVELDTAGDKVEHVEEKKDKVLEKSEMLVSKLNLDEDDEVMDKSFEVEGNGSKDKEDASPANIPEPIIEDLPRQMPVLAGVPADSNVLIEEKKPEEEEPNITDSVMAIQLQAELNAEEPKKAEQPKPAAPAENPADQYYAKLLQLSTQEKKYRSALVQMMDMGFTNFDKNLMLLIAADGNVEHACSQLLQ